MFQRNICTYMHDFSGTSFTYMQKYIHTCIQIKDMTASKKELQKQLGELQERFDSLDAREEDRRETVSPIDLCMCTKELRTCILCVCVCM